MELEKKEEKGILDLSIERLKSLDKMERVEDIITATINPDIIAVVGLHVSQKTAAGLDKGQTQFQEEQLEALGKPFIVINIGDRAKEMTKLTIGDKILIKNIASFSLSKIIKNGHDEEIRVDFMDYYHFLIKLN